MVNQTSPPQRGRAEEMSHGAMPLSKGRILQRPKVGASVYKATPDLVNGEDAGCTVTRWTGLDHFDLPSWVFEEDSQT